MKMKKILALTCAAAMVFGLAACGSAAADTTAADTTGAETADASAEETQAPAEETADLSGTISMAGSTSMEKLANAVAESFMAKYPGVTVTAEFTGSSAGIEAVTAGSVDIGNSSRALKDEEKEAGAVENIVAIDGIAVVTDPANTVSGLTKDQLISEGGNEDKTVEFAVDASGITELAPYVVSMWVKVDKDTEDWIGFEVTTNDNGKVNQSVKVCPNVIYLRENGKEQAQCTNIKIPKGSYFKFDIYFRPDESAGYNGAKQL